MASDKIAFLAKKPFGKLALYQFDPSEGTTELIQNLPFEPLRAFRDVIGFDHGFLITWQNQLIRLSFAGDYEVLFEYRGHATLCSPQVGEGSFVVMAVSEHEFCFFGIDSEGELLFETPFVKGRAHSFQWLEQKQQFLIRKARSLDPFAPLRLEWYQGAISAFPFAPAICEEGHFGHLDEKGDMLGFFTESTKDSFHQVDTRLKLKKTTPLDFHLTATDVLSDFHNLPYKSSPLLQGEHSSVTCIVAMVGPTPHRLHFPFSYVRILLETKESYFALVADLDVPWQGVLVHKETLEPLTPVLRLAPLLNRTILSIPYDGYKLPALLFEPLEQRATKATVVLLHKGPRHHVSAEYPLKARALVRLGFRVLMVNFSGSTGFGKIHRERLFQRMGELDRDEVIHVLKHLREISYLTQPVVLWGGQTGGYLAARILAKAEGIAGAVLVFTPIDGAKMVEKASPPQRREWEFGFGKPPFHDLKERSLYPLLLQAKLPVLLVRGRKADAQLGEEHAPFLLSRQNRHLKVKTFECESQFSTRSDFRTYQNAVFSFLKNL